MIVRTCICVTVLLLTACAPTATGIRFSELPLYKIYSDTQAKIVVFRPNSGTGSGEPLEIVLDGKVEGSVLKGGFIILDTEPGKHTLHTKSNAIDRKQSPRPGRGETLFYKIDFDNYYMTGAWKLIPLDDRTANKQFSEFRSSN